MNTSKAKRYKALVTKKNCLCSYSVRLHQIPTANIPIPAGDCKVSINISKPLSKSSQLLFKNVSDKSKSQEMCDGVF